jgi:hypothetical protein
MVIIFVMLPGCISHGQSDASQNLTTTNNTDAQYIEEYQQGLLHHSSAKDSFDIATTLWDQGNYSDAADRYKNAEQEYGLASDHYKNMEQYAMNESERDFADNVSLSVYDLSQASASFASAAAEPDNNSNAYVNFLKGQDLMNQSDDLMNRSLSLMPSWLGSLS